MDILGPTGKYPQGKLNESDEGELRLAIIADYKNRQVVIDFGSPVHWFSLPPDLALNFAKTILAKVDELGG